MDGQVIFEENSAGKEIYIVESGKIEISQHDETIAVLEKGDFFGEMAPICGTLRSAKATAVGDAYLRSFSLDEMIQHMVADSQYMIDVLQRLVSRLRITTKELRLLNIHISLLGNGREKDTVPEELPTKTEHEAEVFGGKDIIRRYYVKELEKRDREIANLREQLKQSQKLLADRRPRWRRR